MNRNPYLGVTLGVVLLGIWIVAGTGGFMIIEGWGIVDSFYMTVITISTVGFREVHEMSAEGRLFASFLIVVGLGTAAYTLTGLAQLLLEGELVAILGRRKMKSELQKLRDHLIVCGYGRIGRPVVEGIRSAGSPLCVIDRDPSLEEIFREHGIPYLIGDATEEETLTVAGVEHARALLALLPSNAHNLYLTMTAKSIQPKLTVIARALDDKAVRQLKRGGADRIVSPYEIAAVRVLHAALQPTVVDLMELVSHPEYMDVNFGEFRVSETSPLAGRSLAESEIRGRHKVTVIAVKKRDSGQMVFGPDSTLRIDAGDIVVGMGERHSLRDLENACEARV